MRTVLALDTASPAPSIALVTDGGRGGAFSRPIEGGAEAIPSILAALLAEAGVSLENVGAVAVVSGPGSFTGLRAGLAFARGLALARGIPLLLRSTFETAAAACPDPDRADLVLDAGRGDVHVARRRDGRLEEGAKPVPRSDAEGAASRDGAAFLALDTLRPALAATLGRLESSEEPGARVLPPLRYGRPSSAEEKLLRHGAGTP